MKKRILSIILTAALIMGTLYMGIVPITAASSALTLEPVYSAQNIAAGSTPVAVTDNAVSDFTADVDYTVKSDKSASVTFDMPDIENGYRNVYYNDGTKPLGVKSGSGTITNENGQVKVHGTVNGQRGIVTENFADSVSEFDFSFYQWLHGYQNGQICLGTYAKHNTGAHIIFVVRGTSNGGGIMMYNGVSGTKVAEYIPATPAALNGNMKIVCKGDLMTVFYEEEQIISYTLPEGKLYAGPIYFTANNTINYYDNISVDVPANGVYSPDFDSYYEVKLGENVSLGRRINGVYTEIAKSETTLDTDKKYNFNIVRKQGTVTVTADGDEVLKTEIAYPYSESDVSLWCGKIGIAADSADTIDAMSVYDSANIEITDTGVVLNPIQTSVGDVKITSQGCWSDTWEDSDERCDAKFTDNGNGTFSIASPTTKNSHAFFDGFVNNEYGDIYITFNVANNVTVWSWEHYYFAGYDINVPRDATIGNITVTSPAGTAIDCGEVAAYTNSYYTLEFLKKGNTVSVYYYPVGSARTLLFTDEGADYTTDFHIKKQQGTLNIMSFRVYDTIPVLTDEIAENIGDVTVSMPELNENQMIAYKEISGAEALADNSAENYPFVIRYPGSGVNDRLLVYANNTSDQVPPGAEDTVNKIITLHTNYQAEIHQWLLIKVESNVAGNTDNAYVIKSVSSGRYLGIKAGATRTHQVETTDTPYVYHIEPKTDGYGYNIYFVDGSGANKMYLSFGATAGRNGWKIVPEAVTLKLYVTEVISAQYSLAKVDFSGTSDEPMDKADTGVNNFRIPAFATLKNGWLVAVADARWTSFLDSPANIDTICSVSKDGGKTWEWELVNYHSDFASNCYSNASASFIDPQLTVDGEGNIWMLVNTMAQYTRRADYSIVGTTARGVDDQGRLPIIYGGGNGEISSDISKYTYYLDLKSEGVTATDAWGRTQTVHPICAYDGDTSTGVYADAFLNTYQETENGIEPILCDQNNAILVKTQSNLFYAASQWRTYPASFLMLRKGTVTENGLEWGLPRYMDVKNEGENSIVVCPGRGITTTLEDGTERIILPLYDNPASLALSIYSDDGGVTWTRGGKINDTTLEDGTDVHFASESQIVNLPNGNLRMYSRNKYGFISYYDSTDKGVTWGECKNSGLAYTWECMVSFMNVDGVLVDKQGNVHTDLIMASYPRNGNRCDGTVRIGYMDGTDTVTWANESDIFYSGQFAYSVLTQHFSSQGAEQNRFSVLYEPQDSLGVCVSHDSFTIEDITGGEYTLVSYGDIDADGDLDASDITELKKLLLGVKTSDNITTADLNKNGELDIIDLIKLKKKIAGL